MQRGHEAGTKSQHVHIHENVVPTCPRDMSPRVNWFFYNCATLNLGILIFVPATYSTKFNKWNSVRRVAGFKYPANWCCTIIKV